MAVNYIFLQPTFIAIKNIKLIKININSILDFGNFVPKTKWSKHVMKLAYRVSHIEMMETKWLWGVVELRNLMNYGV